MATNKKITEELKAKLQSIADEQEVLVMSFIAPDTIVRKSPVSYDYAKITIQDLYKIEEEIEKLEDASNLPKKLHLVIHTPGGRADASTKIARYLRKKFADIEAYVPYEAASGGTVLCLAANRIVMGDNSNLTPIDTQVPYGETTVSATSYEQAIDDMMSKYSTSRPEEIPSPDQQMCNKFDPVIAKEFSKIVWDSLIIALELLDASYSPKKPQETEKITKAIFALTKTNYPHSHQFNTKDILDMGLTVSQEESKMGLLRTYKQWVSCQLDEKVTNHIITVYAPKPKKEGDSDAEKEPKSTSDKEAKPPEK